MENNIAVFTQNQAFKSRGDRELPILPLKRQQHPDDLLPERLPFII
ncbi:hypothetical protein PJF56_03305 [Roseofilum sp. BLCC_M91]|uniref:Uncharacterized protein n=1 Tax=Roseofilum halophilum BLCC-M91 TaxID=3022259 RepID=A0ABT7BFE0_9CYAN|nr:hypothetical protein [Roseofilum halophilum]MDJ1177885.1 hypothetical protein [Roseofilum halophilum BLCC-M91]